jgi:hypothetical protein
MGDGGRRVGSKSVFIRCDAIDDFPFEKEGLHEDVCVERLGNPWICLGTNKIENQALSAEGSIAKNTLCKAMSVPVFASVWICKIFLSTTLGLLAHTIGATKRSGLEPATGHTRRLKGQPLCSSQASHKAPPVVAVTS